MKINFKKLHSDVGLKFDGTIILGINKVKEFIEQNLHYFENLDLKSISDSHMLYGYNKHENPIKIGFEDNAIRRIIIFTTEIIVKRLIVKIAFDGHLYSGFQIQKKQRTIQGELTRVVSNINGYNTLIHGVSRTDAGVHANNYVIHFDTIRDFDNKRWIDLLNYQLPSDILVKSVIKTHPIFHSRFDVYKKRYIYKIKLNSRDIFRVNYEWNIKNIDLSILEKNLNQLVGTHNFISFCKGTPNSSIRTIYRAELKALGSEIQLIFEGNGFLRYMIRIIVFALVQIASNKLSISIKDIIKEESRKHTKNLAPSSGLYLDEIFY